MRHWLSNLNWLAVAATVSGLVWTTFVVWYWIRATWWKSQIGKNVMILGMLIAFTFDRTAFYLWQVSHEEISGAQYATGLFTYIAAALIGVQRTYLMEQSQRRPVKQNRRAGDPKD